MDYDAERDLIFYNEPDDAGSVILKAGDFAIVPPEDGHAPRRMTKNGACPVKKNCCKSEAVKGRSMSCNCMTRICGKNAEAFLKKEVLKKQ